MKSNKFFIVTLVIFLFCSGFIRPVFGNNSNKDCDKCHSEIYQEWKKTSHANSFLDSTFKKASKNYSKEKCIPCHAPKPLFETGLDKTPEARKANLHQGVNCLSCHKFNDKQYGTLENALGPCNPKFNKQVKTGETCFPCHKNETEEWKKTSFFKKGDTCLTCHMEKVEGEPSKGKKSSYGEHSWPGGKNPLLLESVIRNIHIFQKGEDIIIKFKPYNVGHNFPTGTSGNPSFHILVRIKNNDGIVLKEYRDNFRRTDNADEKDTTLKGDEEITLQYPLPVSKGYLDFIVFYKIYSGQKDSDSTILRNLLYEII